MLTCRNVNSAKQHANAATHIEELEIVKKNLVARARKKREYCKRVSFIHSNNSRENTTGSVLNGLETHVTLVRDRDARGLPPRNTVPVVAKAFEGADCTA